VPELARAGLNSATVALPSVGRDPKSLGGMMDDAKAIEDAVASIAGDVMVVAHSYGGVPATQARYEPRVRHLFYIGAFMPDLGQSLVTLLPPGPLPPFVIANEDGTTAVNLDVVTEAFYPDVPPEIAAWATARLALHNVAAITTPVTRCAWREIESSYLLLADDQPCPTPVQRNLVTQATHRYEMSGGHFPFLSRPAEVAAVLARAAQGAGEGAVAQAG
jgi:pimeloyl-ACP methyl ester carboxylesterase